MAARMHRVKIGHQGRLVVPAELRRELGIQREDDLIAWAEEGRLVLRRRDDVVQELWDMFAPVDRSLSAEVIREHREDARRGR